MNRRMLASALALAITGATAAPALAWEPETTQAGLAEQAGLASALHKRLVSLGFGGGLFEPLTIPPADAPALIEALHQLSPSHGSVPDARGRQSALAWLTAGAAVADIPAAHGANHFFDPTTGRGWSRPSRGLFASIAAGLRGAPSIPAHGMPAPDWITAADNPLNVDAFLAQYARAVSAPTAGERARHLASALIAAGAILHTLGDLGVPARVRGDGRAQLDQLGGGPDDLGSRFERIAALAYGRLGVPPPATVITRAHLRDYFTTAPAGSGARANDTGADVGLADWTARTFFSPGSLPRPSQVTADEAHRKLARPLPVLPAKLALTAATREDGTTLRDAAGVCLARYKVEHGILAFSLDDQCELEQASVILPVVAAYETGALDFLFRGELTVALDSGQVVVTGKKLGAGTVTVLAEDDRGVRTPLTAGADKLGPGELARVGAPSGGIRVVALFVGVDAAGERIVAAGALALPH